MERDLLYHFAVILAVDEFVIGVAFKWHFLEFFAGDAHLGEIGMNG